MSDATPAEAASQFIRDAGNLMRKGKGSPEADRQAAVLATMGGAAAVLTLAREQSLANLLELAKLDLPGLDPRIRQAAAQSAAVALLDLEAVFADQGD